MRIRSVLATLAATAVAAVTLPMAAQAAPGNTVVFGDSLPANPTVGDWLTAKDAPIPGGRVNEMGCGTDFLFSNDLGDLDAAKAEFLAAHTLARSKKRRQSLITDPITLKETA